MKRRLAAILAADVVGYSRMIRADEIGTIAALRRARVEVVDSAIARHDGRVVKLMGDGLLVEFSSTVDAMQAAVDVQRTMPDWNGDTPQDRQITFRVGINLGDVIIDGDDIQGDGVNVAARLEAMAAPGAVSVSDAVHDQVRDRLALTFEDQGALELKNITRPVRVWAWSPAHAKAPDPLPEDVLPALPDKPSIAVLPFQNMSPDPEQEFFADGIAEDLITALSQSRSLFVVSRNSAFAYRGQSVDIRQVGRELGVRYVLEGSVRRAGDRVRITAQLIEADTGTHVWAERFDRPTTDIFQVQDEITTQVAGMINSEIWAFGIRAVAARPDDQLRMWERAQKAFWYFNRKDEADHAKGMEICRAEMARNPDSHMIHAAFLLGSQAELTWGFGDRTPPEIIREGIEVGRRAVALEPNDESIRCNLSLLLWTSGNHEAAFDEASEAIRINPNNPVSHIALAASVGFTGADRHDEARAMVETAIRLGPRDLNIIWGHTFLGMFDFVAGNYAQAIPHLRTALRLDPNTGTAARFLAASLALDGQDERARAEWARACDIQPLDLQKYALSLHRMFRRADEAERAIEGMRRAGGNFGSST